MNSMKINPTNHLTNQKNWPISIPLLLITLLLSFGLNQRTSAQTYTLSNAWTVANGTAHLANSANNRGVAYGAISNQVFVSTRTGAATGFIDVFDGTAGTLLSGSGGIAGANLGIDQVGVGDDGTLYGTPLDTGLNSTTGNLTLYSWTNWNSNPTPYSAYLSASGDAAVANFTGKRIGDTLTVTGAGTNTLILMGIGAQGTNFLLFHTSDGINFTPTAVFVPTGLPSTAGNIFGISFYTNGTFLVLPGANATSHNVFLVSYPANFASQSSVVGTVLGSAPTLTANLTTAINYSPAGQMLAVVQTASQTVNTNAIYSLTNFPTAASSLASTTVATPNSNGNATGGGALGGQGKTNYLYVLESNNGLQAYEIYFTLAALPPTITSQPTGATIYPPYTLTVSVSGTAPFAYQWQVTNSANAGSFSNIPGAITNFYTISAPLSTNFYRVIITNSVGSVTSSVVLVTTLNPVTNSAVSSLWRVNAGQQGYSFLPASGDATRGISYDTNSQNVVVSSSSGLYILNGNTGATNGSLSLSGAAFGGVFGGPDQVGIADDGAVYAGNLTANGQSVNFNLFRWSTPTNGATITAGSAAGGAVFSGDPGVVGASSTADRWGDYLAVRGAGLNTQILLASKGTNVALMTTGDGVNFSSSVIGVSGVPIGFAAGGISFGAGNTFWAKSYLGDLWEISFDPIALVGTVVFDYKNPSQFSSYIVGLGVDPINNILAGVNLSDNPNDMQLFELTGTSDSPLLFNQTFFGSVNGNGNDNAAVVIKYPRAYALDVNNGVVAVTYGVPSTTAPSISSPPASQSAYANVSAVTFSVSASGSLPLFYQWRFNSNNITGANSSSYMITNPPLSAAGYYDVVVHNIAGSITSAPPALLTLVIPTLSTVVTQLWTIPAGTYSFLDGSTYATRGLAYDTNTAQVLVADHNNIHLLAATNGSYLGDLGTTAVPTTGLNGWLFDQIGVSDDGTLYAANLVLAGTGFSIVSWPPGFGPNTQPTQFAYGNGTGGDPGNGSNDRWGDTMSVRGSGLNTQILIGSGGSSNVVLFTTTDGATFTPLLIAVTNIPPSATTPFSSGIAFGAGNTFWAKGGHFYDLRQVAFDPASGFGSVIQDFSAGTQVPNDLVGLSLDVSNNILAGVCLNDSPNDMQLYLLSGNSNAPALVDQAFFGSKNANAQDNGATVLKAGLGFGLDVNNGLVAISYGTPIPAPAVTLTSVAYAPGNVTINWNNVFNGHSYQVQYKNTLLDPSWINIGSPITTTNATASYTDTTASGATRFYRVISQ
jgi:hypothetical protein